MPAQRDEQFLAEDSISPEFAGSIRRGIAQADAGETVVCHDLDDMVEKLLSDR